MPPLEGVKLGCYRLLCRLATGGMAEVWIAEGPNSRADPLVCVKLVLAGLERDEQFLSMFIQEARLAAPLLHPNLVQIDDLGLGAGRLYLAMEYIRGHALSVLAKELAARGERLSPGLAVAMVAQVARGLDYAHDFRDQEGRALGLVHRDVSPHNLILRVDGRLKVVDFGIAKATSIAGTRTGSLKGKAGYMSPEQIHGRGIDRRTDVFALGVTLWELLAGTRLFRGSSELETLTMVLTGPIPDPREHTPSLPEGLCRLILRALSRKLDQRVATAGELAEGLEAFARAELYGPAEPALADLAARVLPPLPRTVEEALEHARRTALPEGSLLAAGPPSANPFQALDPTLFKPATASDPRKTRPDRARVGAAARTTEPLPAGLVDAAGVGVERMESGGAARRTEPLHAGLVGGGVGAERMESGGAARTTEPFPAGLVDAAGVGAERMESGGAARRTEPLHAVEAEHMESGAAARTTEPLPAGLVDAAGVGVERMESGGAARTTEPFPAGLVDAAGVGAERMESGGAARRTEPLPAGLVDAAGVGAGARAETVLLQRAVVGPPPRLSASRRSGLLAAVGALFGLGLAASGYLGWKQAAVAPPSPQRQALPAPPEPESRVRRPGFLTLRTEPWCEVSLDGAAMGRTPLVRVPVPSGKSLLRLANPTEGAFLVEVVVEPDEHHDMGILALEDLSPAP